MPNWRLGCPGQGHLSTGLDPSASGPTLEVLFEPVLGSGAPKMNQPSHPYLLPLEFILGVGGYQDGLPGGGRWHPEERGGTEMQEG